MGSYVSCFAHSSTPSIIAIIWWHHIIIVMIEHVWGTYHSLCSWVFVRWYLDTRSRPFWSRAPCLYPFRVLVRIDNCVRARLHVRIRWAPKIGWRQISGWSLHSTCWQLVILCITKKFGEERKKIGVCVYERGSYNLIFFLVIVSWGFYYTILMRKLII